MVMQNAVFRVHNGHPVIRHFKVVVSYANLEMIAQGCRDDIKGRNPPIERIGSLDAKESTEIKRNLAVGSQTYDRRYSYQISASTVFISIS
jgi:hypothetical protein